MHERSRASLNLCLCVVDCVYHFGVKLRIVFLQVGVERFCLVSHFLASSHIAVLDADHIVVEVDKRHVAVRRLDVVDIRTVCRLSHFLLTYLVGDVLASCHEDGVHGQAPSGVSAACLSSHKEILAIREVTAADGNRPFQFFHLCYMGSRSFFVPCDFHTEAAVAQVAGYGSRENHFIQS